MINMIGRSKNCDEGAFVHFLIVYEWIRRNKQQPKNQHFK